MDIGRVRDARSGDLDALRVIFREASLSNEGDRPALQAHPEVLEWPGSGLREGRVRVVENTHGQVCGFITTTTNGSVMEVEDLFVRPEVMRQGVARLLINDMAAIARAGGVAVIEVTANHHALEFYKAVGFCSDGPTETEFGVGERMHLRLL